MKTQMKFDHNCHFIEGAIGYSKEQFYSVLDKSNELIQGINDRKKGHETSRIIEAFVMSDLTRDDLAIALAQALKNISSES